VRELATVHDTEGVSGNKLGQQFDCISSNIAALVFQTSRSQLRSGLSPLGELLFQVADPHQNLDRSATAVRVNVEETLFQHIEECIDLRLGVFARLFLPAQVGDEVTADLNHGASEGVGLEDLSILSK
jgi:hypothetical protein